MAAFTAALLLIAAIHSACRNRHTVINGMRLSRKAPQASLPVERSPSTGQCDYDIKKRCIMLRETHRVRKDIDR